MSGVPRWNEPRRTRRNKTGIALSVVELWFFRGLFCGIEEEAGSGELRS